MNKNTYYENRLNLIQNLPENWGGLGTSAISNNILEKCKFFLSHIPCTIDNKGIAPTPYGTLTIDIYNEKNELISVEITENEYAFFTRFEDKTKNTIVECTLNLKDFLTKIHESLFLLVPEDIIQEKVWDIFQRHQLTTNQENRVFLILNSLQVRKFTNFRFDYSLKKNIVVFVRTTQKGEHRIEVDKHGNIFYSFDSFESSKNNEKHFFEYEIMTCEEFIEIKNKFLTN